MPSPVKTIVLPKKSPGEKKRAAVILSALKNIVPDATMILRFNNPWECLVAVILSAQSTDKQVNKITPNLFKKYTSIADYASADPKEFEKDIFSSGFYRSKTKHILTTAQMLIEKFNGKVPHTMEDMVTLRGVSRKTANVVLGNVHGVVEGIAVDTHVKRLAKRLGLTKHSDPHKIELDLMALFPHQEWFMLTYYLIEYGRRYCTARVKNHTPCPLAHFEKKS